ncbi:hypothetical protein [Streptomyces sp. MZ04]|uniref:hypothetical protein n=1 Tax=Streptomyces sp. MZ04 TaxID=2559236 RepID=UPI00107E6DFE|nr:hypothetical protein [Streptomyces sp. MZ04]TGB11596.1 hypothetical protein E2651_13025 [Streptomyces sp. MZ04]
MTTTPSRDIAALDVPLTVLEGQLAELRAHAVQHLTERGTEPSPEQWVQWHDFLDIDPDLRGRNYSQPAKPHPGGAA